MDVDLSCDTTDSLVMEMVGCQYFSQQFGTNLAQVYWTDNGDSTPKRINPDGTGKRTIASGEIFHLVSLWTPFLKVYWTDYTSKVIRWADLDGSNAADLLTTTNIPTAMDIDVQAEKNILV